MELTARKLDLIEKALRLAVLLVDKPDADPAEVAELTDLRDEIHFAAAQAKLY